MTVVVTYLCDGHCNACKIQRKDKHVTRDTTTLDRQFKPTKFNK